MAREIAVDWECVAGDPGASLFARIATATATSSGSPTRPSGENRWRRSSAALLSVPDPGPDGCRRDRVHPDPVREHNTADPQHAVEIRIGIHIGQVTEYDGYLQGQAVHAAARVMAEAVGGQILTSDEVRRDAEPQVDWPFLDSGLFWLRGFPERWRL